MPSPLVTQSLSERVLSAMKDATDAEVMPRWRALADGDVRTKTAEWDVVTDADVLAEKQLTITLQELIDIPVVGEEATAADPSLLGVVGSAEACWLVDPVDGTRNFVAGSEDFACMVALVEAGRTVAAWITYPAVGREMHGAIGVGAFVDGQRVTAPVPSDASALRGALGAKLFMDDAEGVVERAKALGVSSPIRFCAGWDYLDIVTGATEYVLFSRSLPWDHAPGTVIAEAAGLRAARFDGSDYWPGDDRTGLLTAHPSVWERVRDGLGLA